MRNCSSLILEMAMAVVLLTSAASSVHEGSTCGHTFLSLLQWRLRHVWGRCLGAGPVGLLGGNGSAPCCLAVATAPATTILVLKEFALEGPITECTGFLVAMNNFACIVMFELAFSRFISCRAN
ncbi:MAG: hypothetical protein R3C02_02790 [Planctomycetaceae bacterium]